MVNEKLTKEGSSSFSFDVINIDNSNKLKSGKDIILEGYISTNKVDFNNDIVTEEAQESMVTQIKDRISKGLHITMDLDHESYERDKDDPSKATGKILDKIPVAKIIDAKLEKNGDEVKTKVKAKLNKSHPMYENIKKSILNKFLHSFSIAYKVIDGFVTKIDDKIVKVLKDIHINNIGITGVPVNDEATFEVQLKSYLKKMEENNKIKDLETTVTELKSVLDEKDKTINELKSKFEEQSTEVKKEIEGLNVNELKSKVDKFEETLNELTELKSKFEDLNKELTELKSQPVNKAVKTTETKLEDINVFSLMN